MRGIQLLLQVERPFLEYESVGVVSNYGENVLAGSFGGGHVQAVGFISWQHREN